MVVVKLTIAGCIAARTSHGRHAVGGSGARSGPETFADHAPVCCLLLVDVFLDCVPRSGQTLNIQSRHVIVLETQTPKQLCVPDPRAVS